MDAIVAAAIHDAKNGLNALNTWLAAAEREHPSSALTEARAVATRVGAQLVELLALYRANEGSLRLAIDDHDMGDFCADVLAELTLPAGSSLRVEQDLAIAGELGAWAFDAYQVKLVLLDALRNAARHARTVIFLSLRREVGGTGGLCFEVRDDGEGFAPEILAGAATTMDAGSSGLGLRFARLIAERHATPDGRCGRVDLKNDGGAVFRLILP
jgi:signal transduction histidine kinase